jgi:WD40 repeat protein
MPLGALWARAVDSETGGTDEGVAERWSTRLPPLVANADTMICAVAIGRAVDGRAVVVSGNEDWTVRAWDALDGTPIGPAPMRRRDHSHPLAVTGVEIDGRGAVVAAGAAGTDSPRIWIGVWAAPSGPLIGEVTGDAGMVDCLATGSLGGRTVIVSGCHDGTVRIWNAAACTPVGDPLVGHEGPVWAVAVGELDGRAIVLSGGADGSVRV